MLSFAVSAQLDTAWMKLEYGDNYINPQLIDPAYETYFSVDSLMYSGNGLRMLGNVSNADMNTMYTAVAQRFDLMEDTLRLEGVALLASHVGQESYFDPTPHYDSIRVAILNSSMAVVYEKKFISGGFQDGRNSFDIPKVKFVECFFDSVVSITGDDHYFVSLESLEIPCYNSDEGWSHPTKFVFARKNAIELPCGCGAKYRVHAWKCNDRNEWTPPEDIDWLEWSDFYYGFGSICEYPIYAPAGIFPMRAVEDTTTMALANVELGSDAVTLYPNPTKSGEVTVEAAENILSIEIYDIANRLVRTESANAKSVRLNLSALSSGTYLAKVRTKSGTVARKFIIE